MWARLDIQVFLLRAVLFFSHFLFFLLHALPITAASISLQLQYEIQSEKVLTGQFKFQLLRNISQQQNCHPTTTRLSSPLKPAKPHVSEETTKLPGP